MPLPLVDIANLLRAEEVICSFYSYTVDGIGRFVKAFSTRKRHSKETL